MDQDDIAAVYGNNDKKRNHPGNILSMPEMTSELKKLTLNKEDVHKMLLSQQVIIDLQSRKLKTLEANQSVMRDQIDSLSRAFNNLLSSR